MSQIKPGELPPTEKQLQQSHLLMRQQRAAVACPDFYQALRSIHQIAKAEQIKKRVFVSYAWPSLERKNYENWMQEFLLTLRYHLEEAHLTVLLDLTNSRQGYNSYNHMDEILECDYVILIGTESLLDKHNAGISAICNELNRIREKRLTDAERGLFRVIPLVISGEIDKAIPIEYMRYTVIESFYQQGYVDTVFHLLRKFFGFEKHKKFLEILKEYQRKHPAVFNLLSPFALLESHHRPDLQAELPQQISTNAATAIKPSANQKYQISVSIADRNPLQSLQSKLKSGYRKTASELRLLFGQKKHSLKDHYINLALIEQKEIERQQGQQFLDSDYSIPGLNKTHVKEIVKKKIALADVFEQCEVKEETQHIAIYGGAGIGKSTLCQHIAYQWSTDQLWQNQFNFIFWIKLRDLADAKLQSCQTLAELLEQLCFIHDLSEQERNALKTLTTDLSLDKPFLIVLDGYDETPQNLFQDAHKTQFKKPFDKLFSHSHILLTSRPQTLNGLSNEYRVEIQSLEPEQIQGYINQFFPNDVEQQNSLKNYLAQNSLASGLAEIPLNLELICSVWQEGKLQNELSLTQLYQTIIQFLSKRYLAKFTDQSTQKLTLEMIEDKCATWLPQLEHLAWQMFAGEVNEKTHDAKIEIYFDHDLLKQVLPKDEAFASTISLLIDQSGC